MCDDHFQYLSRFTNLPFPGHFFVNFTDKISLGGGGGVPDDQFGNCEKPSYSGGKGGCYEVGAVPLELHGT